ncbi:phospholipase A1-like [Bombus pyrosoma]|uniref:phospholipase A1-like n=1 Tax=Bombus pyrosoma TaxID=396416 RepID=UPI001CB988DC|nr:phospholipase A1-like [Bombus pyrosoma]
MIVTLNLLSSKFYPTLLALLVYADPIFRTEGDRYLDLFRINIAPLPKNLTLDTYLDAINFTLYTRENPTDGEILKLNDVESIRNSHWNPNRQTIVMIHGWIQNGLASAILRDAFFDVRDCNVIIIDWSEISNYINYSEVVKLVPHICRYIASFINFLRTKAGLQTTNLKIIGHSLGAQIAGLSAREVGKSSRVGEVIALDPAMPMFQDRKPSERINESNAKNVQVLHTCAGRLGMNISIGTSDFYANDGIDQPGCGTDLFGFCAHMRSYNFFAESIRNPKGFLGIRADGATAYMGGATPDPNAKGTYYFKTNSQYPYALDG